jgi:TetR/AcrR family transcriptional repressor of nem operon
MGRPRGFNESDAVRAAARLFAGRSYDGVSVDDLVGYLGVHRHSLYRAFGSKRGLYMAALRWHMANQLYPTLADVADGDPETLRQVLTADMDPAPLDLVLMAAIERAPRDSEVAAEVDRALAAVDTTVADVLGLDQNGGSHGGSPPAAEVTAMILGLRLRGRAVGPQN